MYLSAVLRGIEPARSLQKNRTVVADVPSTAKIMIVVGSL